MNIRPSQLKGSKPNKAILSSFSWKEPYARSTGRHLDRSRAGPGARRKPAEMGKSDFKEKWPYMLCWHERPADSLDTLKQKDDDDDEGILQDRSKENLQITHIFQSFFQFPKMKLI